MRRSWTLLLLAALLADRVRSVEDGQFTREYSRLYTALVFGLAGGLLLVALVVVALLRRR